MAQDITYRTGTYYGETGENHIWEITDEQGIAAELYASLDHHEIMNIEVRNDRRGEGLARQLFETADQQIGIYHTLDAHMTPEGKAFFEAVGGEQVTECHMTDVCNCTEIAA